MKNQQASKMQKSKTSKHTPKPYKKPASIGKHAAIVGKLGGRPRKDGIQKAY
jgi:hypothetical protein